MQRIRSVLALVSALALPLALGSAGCGRLRGERRFVDPTSERTVDSGKIVGFVGTAGSHVWLGIPYAKPPVADLRWRPAVPPEPWSGAREGLAPGAPCVQYGSIFAGISTVGVDKPGGSEDCLYANVYAPRLTKHEVAEAKLPVMVWIHGGGNTIGEAAFYDGGRLAKSLRVVVVAVNYRLGPFGWFGHAALREAESTPEGRSGNFGTLDLVRALQWVQKNAASFGGDPANVTIFGESAGAANVLSLLVSPPARGLFHRAIAQSGRMRSDPVEANDRYVDDPEPGDPNGSSEAVLRMLVKAGRAADRNAAKVALAKMSKSEAASFLRSLSAYDVLGAFSPQPGLGMISMPQPLRDGTVLPSDDFLAHIRNGGAYNQVPLILGTNRDEYKLFMAADPQYVKRLLWVFPRLIDETSYNLHAEYVSRMWKALGADEPAAAMARAQGASVYVYRFDWDEEPRVYGSDLSVLIGAAHGIEIPFVFGHWDLGRQLNMIFTKENQQGRFDLSTRMMSYWTQHASVGSPGKGRGGQRVEWLPWDASDPKAPKMLILDSDAGGGIRMSGETVTSTAVLAAVDADSRLPTQRDKCRIFRTLAQRGMGIGRADYPRAGAKGCAEFPFDGYPW